MSNQPEDSAAVPPSRYQQFRRIMDAAAGTSGATYDGYRDFWNLPLEQLKAVVLYGVRLFPDEAEDAPLPPAVVASIDPTGECHFDEHDGPEPAKRGAASGIVRALRGQFPFDGTQFPRIPWGGTRVSDADVTLIEQWIDDGAPEYDADTAESVRAHHEKHARASGAQAHPEHDRPINELFAATGSIKQRKNINALSAEEIRRLRVAFGCMKKLDPWYQDERSFGYWARIHANQCQHGWEEFLTWHRVYLYEFELKLQDFDKSVTLPYWDWTDQSKEDVFISVQDAAVAGPAAMDNGVIPELFRCYVDAGVLRNLEGKIPADYYAGLAKLSTGGDCGGPQTFCSGSRLFAAAGITYRKDRDADATIIAELERANPLFHWRRWPGGNQDLMFQAYPTQDDVDTILAVDSFFDFGSGPTDDQYFGLLENIHNLIHNFTGGVNPNYHYDPNDDADRENPDNPQGGEPAFGDMQNGGATAYDPIFWFHHANVDRLWAEWQKLHPNVSPDNPTAVLPPWTLLVSDTASTRKLGYEYVANSHLFLTDSSTPIERFRSADVTKPKAVVQRHRKAEIRVHTVQYVTRGGYHVRAFLNMPDATIDTPTTGNPSFVGQVNVLTGLCIGGPGHCAVPKRSTNRFDKRPRHHKTPSNLRFDATAAVKALSDAGVTEFHVNLVVFNSDGTPATDALYIDGVSLNFID
jgi:tyrosinase